MNNQLYRETLKLIKETNRRLAKLEKGVDVNKGIYNPKTKRFERKDNQVIYKGGKRTIIKSVKRVNYPIGSWASKKLIEKVPESIFNGKITSNISSYSNTQLIALNKALKKFLRTETSTIKGIRKKEREIKMNIKNELEDFNEESLTSQEINTLYDFFNDSDFNYVTMFIPPSDLWKLLIESKSRGEDSSGFIKRVAQYIDEDSLYEDLDLKDALIRIYNKFNL